jgi:hypothetical protein
MVNFVQEFLTSYDEMVCDAELVLIASEMSEQEVRRKKMVRRTHRISDIDTTLTVQRSGP